MSSLFLFPISQFWNFPQFNLSQCSLRYSVRQLLTLSPISPRSSNWWLINSLLQQHLPVINFVDFCRFCKNRFSGAQYWLSSTWRSNQSGTVSLKFSPQWWLFIVCAHSLPPHKLYFPDLFSCCCSHNCSLWSRMDFSSLTIAHFHIIRTPRLLSHIINAPAISEKLRNQRWKMWSDLCLLFISRMCQSVQLIGNCVQ